MGIEWFRQSHPHMFYRGLHGVLLCYSVSDRQTLDSCEEWMKEIREYAQQDVVITLVGIVKMNQQRQVTTKEGQQYADSHGIDFFEVTPHEMINVNEVFQTMTDTIIKNTYVPMEINEIITIFTKWTGKTIGTKLFDTMKDNWNIKTCQLHERIRNKSELLIFIDEGDWKFGCYINATIDKIGKPIEDHQAFVYSINKKDKVTIQHSQQAIQFYPPENEMLMTIGKKEIGIYKQEKQQQSYYNNPLLYPHQSTEKKGFFSRLFGSNNTLFSFKRLVIFQMQ